MKKLLFSVLLLLALACTLSACVLPETEPVITTEDGYLVVNGIKTEYEVNTADEITVEGGYLVVNGVKTEHKIYSEPVISVIDGYVAVNGVKTQYSVVAFGCNHIWETVTTAPTCTAGGYDTMTCLLCDKSVQTNETAKIEHTYATTYTADDNYHWFACSVCGDVKDKSIPWTMKVYVPFVSAKLPLLSVLYTMFLPMAPMPR